MNLSGLVIAILLFVGMGTGFYIFYSETLGSYGLTPEGEELNQTLTGAISTDLNETASDLEQAMLDVSKQETILGKIISSVGVLVSMLKVLLEIPGLISGFFTTLINSMKIFPITVPNWFMTMVLTIISVFVIFKLLSGLGGRET